MSAVSNGDVINLFKRVYGDLTNLLPQDYPLARDIPFSQKMKVGEKYVEAVVLTNESGITLSATTDAFELNPSIAGVIKQTEVTPYISVLPSIVPWGVMSRTAGGGERAFFDATKFIVKNNLLSHGKFQEIFRLYGQADGLLGYVSYYTGIYRGVSLTNGTGTINGIAFTNGVNAASKAILFAPGSFAAGIWVGLEGVMLNEVNASGTVVASGKLVSVNTTYGYITVDFTPTAASNTTSTRLCFQGMQSAQDYIGIQKVLSTNGNLFGIPTSSYSLWRGNTYNCQNQRLTLGRFQEGVANMVNQGGMEGDVNVYLNPRSWATLATTEAGLRVYDKSYNPKEADNGFDSITFYTQTGKATFIPHRMVKEGDAFCLAMSTWARSGSAEVSFQIPGMGQDVIFPLSNQAGYAFRSYSDQYVFCHKPAWNLYFYNINDESAT
jgi:hypothetical protein